MAAEGGDLVIKPDEKVFFPSTWVEALALEYAKAHAADADTPVDLANIYIDAANQIREALARSISEADR